MVKSVIEAGVYRHFKGKLYHVLTTAEHTETGERMVVYQAMYGYGRVYVTPLDMFTSKVDKRKYSDADQEYRFKFIASVEDYEKM